MGIFNNIKKMIVGIFEDEPEQKTSSIKDEVYFEEKNQYKEEIKKSENKKDEMEDIISERELFRSDTTFKFPVIFEDEDFVAEKKQTRSTNVLSMETSKIKEQAKKEPKEEPKKQIFRPSPIISPVYGVLDKNYQKEDILAKKEDSKSITIEKKIDFDIVHKKAYGSLSDIIENSIENEDNTGMFFNLKEDINIKPEEDSLLSDMSINNDEVLVIEEDIIINNPIDEYEDFGIDYVKMEENVTKEENNDNNKDLFNLIDSMYDNKEEF
jgi:hypothetical protein